MRKQWLCPVSSILHLAIVTLAVCSLRDKGIRDLWPIKPKPPWHLLHMRLGSSLVLLLVRRHLACNLELPQPAFSYPAARSPGASLWAVANSQSTEAIHRWFIMVMARLAGLALLSTCLFFSAAQDSYEFINPPPAVRTLDFDNNPVYQIGTTLEIQWESPDESDDLLSMIMYQYRKGTELEFIFGKRLSRSHCHAQQN
jgi:hypothetical protein